MGLATAEIRFFAAALEARILPTDADILEFGESQVYGDTGIFLNMLAPRLPPEMVITARALLQITGNGPDQAFAAARVLYRAIFNHRSYTTLDHPACKPPPDIPANLNEPVNFEREWDCVINNGVAEHVCDLVNVMRAMHDATRVGGVMLHIAPCMGWYDHGFFNLQPGFFMDLASANNYEVLLIGIGDEGGFYKVWSKGEGLSHLANHPLLMQRCEVFSALRRTKAETFRVPQQEMYR